MRASTLRGVAVAIAPPTQRYGAPSYAKRMTDPHDASSHLAYQTTGELLADLTAGRTTSAQIVDSLVERIAAIDLDATPTRLNAISAQAPDARTVAAQRDDERQRGVIRGPLHGIPVLIKDNIEALGLPGDSEVATILAN